MNRGFIELYDENGYRYIVNMDEIVAVSVAGKKIWCGNATLEICDESMDCLCRRLVGGGNEGQELADLIEDNQYGGTCRNVYPNNEDHHCDNGFRCSACGDTVEDCENYRVSGTWNYCPKCRAKVVG